MSAVPAPFQARKNGDNMPGNNENTSTLLSSVKGSQRVVNTKVDTDFTELIAACKNELLRLGISQTKVASEDTEIVQACKLYVHWMTDYDGKGSQWGQMYVNFTNAMSMHEDYLEEASEEDV